MFRVSGRRKPVYLFRQGGWEIRRGGNSWKQRTLCWCGHERQRLNLEPVEKRLGAGKVLRLEQVARTLAGASASINSASLPPSDHLRWNRQPNYFAVCFLKGTGNCLGVDIHGRANIRMPQQLLWFTKCCSKCRTW